MPTLVIARTVVENPMGAQAYETAIAHHAPAALGPDWQVQHVVTRSMRSPLPGTHRIPAGRLGRAPEIVRRTAGRLLYPRASVVHRTNLELPPAPQPDVLTLHDITAWKYPDESPPVRAAVAELRRAAAVICVSTYTAQEAVAFLGIDDPVVVPNGVADDSSTRLLSTLEPSRTSASRRRSCSSAGVPQSARTWHRWLPLGRTCSAPGRTSRW